MTSLTLIKLPNNVLIGIDDESCEYIEKMKPDSAITANVKKMNNPAFHRKLFALFKIGYDAWEPQTKEYKGNEVSKNFDQFRRDITILAGYYDTVINFRGEVRLIAKSLSFDKMDNDEREKLYSEVINVILSRILTNYTKADLDEQVEKVLNFDGGRF